jgi:GNAT superfamily N-acetyltransferase
MGLRPLSMTTVADMDTDPVNAGALSAEGPMRKLAPVRFEVVPIAGELAQNAIAAYFDELNDRFEGGFEPSSGGADDDARLMSPPRGAFLVATLGDDLFGCGGVQHAGDGVAEIKRMWIQPTRRGEGLGSRLLRQLESTAASLGYNRVVLDTNRVLTEAVSLYERSGYRPIERYNDNPYAHHWFAKDLQR